jgi:hypothetical protein
MFNERRSFEPQDLQVDVVSRWGLLAVVMGVALGVIITGIRLFIVETRDGRVS